MNWLSNLFERKVLNCIFIAYKVLNRSYKDAAVIIKQAGALVFNMSAVVVYLAEVNEITHLEVAQYSIEQFLSDVGGAAGLFMGMSMATVLGTFDCISMMVYESIILVSFDLFV